MPIQIVAATAAGVPYDSVPPNRSTVAHSNGGSVAKANNTSLVKGVSVSRYNTNVFGSTVIDRENIDPSNNSGVFAYNNQEPIAPRVTKSLSTVNNNVLLSGASVPSLTQSIHKSEGTSTTKYTTAIRSGHFNIYDGTFDAGYPVHTNDSFNTDVAANPSRLVPGVLVYKGSAPSSVTKNYAKKTG